MTLNGTNGKNCLAGTELSPDGLDLVLLQDHLRRNPEDVETWQVLLQLQTATDVVEPLPLHLWQDIGDQPTQPWLIPEWLPVGAVTLLSGKGGLGKSRLSLQLATAISGRAGPNDNWGGPALSGTLAEGTPVFIASWEDSPAVIARRLSQISGASATWVKPTMPLYTPGEKDLGLTGSRPLYGTQERWGPSDLTPIWTGRDAVKSTTQDWTGEAKLSGQGKGRNGRWFWATTNEPKGPEKCTLVIPPKELATLSATSGDIHGIQTPTLRGETSATCPSGQGC